MFQFLNRYNIVDTEIKGIECIRNPVIRSKLLFRVLFVFVLQLLVLLLKYHLVNQ